MIKFKFDLDKQQLFYKNTLEHILDGFYSEEKFYVLPYLPLKFRSRVVYFPEIPNYENIYKKHKMQIEHLEMEWNKISDEINKRILKLFPESYKFNIVISPQLVGTVGSFILKDKEFLVMPRFDRKIHGVIMLIVNALTKHFNDITWNEKQRLTIINFDKLNYDDIIDKPKSMLTILDKNMSGKLAEESSKYLENFKFKKETKTDLTGLGLTKNEKIIFDLLVVNKNKLVSVDIISHEIWKDKIDEKYSLYAISRLMTRLRNKIKIKTGRNLIHNQRGVGYILHI